MGRQQTPTAPSPKSAVLSEEQSAVTAQARPLDLHDITGASEHVSTGRTDSRAVFSHRGGGGQGRSGGRQPAPTADVGGGRVFERGQAAAVVIKGAPP